jgi:peptide-methionine (R)-S-oxide reductase
MNRRLFIAAAATSALPIAVNRGVFAATDSTTVKGDFPPVNKTRKEWQKLLNSEQYRVLFEEATERPWTSPLNDEKREGIYICAACYLPLFLPGD